MAKKAESIFSISYLIFDLIAAIIFFSKSLNNNTLFLFGILTFILGFGDAFHLVPRIFRDFNIEKENIEWWIGFGLAFSSITMTIFYIILYYIWLNIFPDIYYPIILSPIIWISALLRIILCLFPQNNWFSYKGNSMWSIYRNIPFVFTGASVATLYFISDNLFNFHLNQIGIAIIISFICYLPVVLFSKKNPKIGLLMIPKTLAYVWIITIGLSLIDKI